MLFRSDETREQVNSQTISLGIAVQCQISQCSSIMGEYSASCETRPDGVQGQNGFWTVMSLIFKCKVIANCFIYLKFDWY